MGGQDWWAINKHGHNTFLKPPTEDPGWMAAIEDVGWVLDGLLGVQ